MLLRVDEALELVDAALHIRVGRLQEPLAADERRRAEPEPDDRHREGAVSPAGAVADLPRLEHGNLELGVAALQRQRRRHAEEAATDDRDVGLHLAVQRRGGLIVAVLGEPERKRRVG